MPIKFYPSNYTGSGLRAIRQLLLFLLLFASPATYAQKPAVSPKPSFQKNARPPEAEKITENTFRVGSSIIDTKARTVTCPGEINLREGSIEYLAVAPGGKTHESLLLARVPDRAALLAALLERVAASTPSP